ncbi:MAG TPA: efflux RND transporter periplasmic adaptor subunit [Bryobacteraceae bacterium]|nr:efflux RND transporter periplasmic adaptor subunit [Bryobacteraceae bacterium]
MKRAILIAGLALAAAGCGKSPQSTAASPQERPSAAAKPAGEIVLDATRQRNAGIMVEAASTRRMMESVEAAGKLAPDEERTWRVGALTAGRIAGVLVNVGDTVRKNQVIAQIYSHEVHESRAAYRRAATEVERALAAEQHALRVRDRARRLFELKAASREQVETAENEYRSAQAQVASARTNVEAARHHVIEFLDISIDGSDNVPVRAPATGLVTDRRVTPGTVVSPGDEIATITDPSSIWMIAAVNEADLSHLRIGQTVRVRVRAWPDQPFLGRVLRLGEQLDPATRTLQVRVGLPNPGGRLKPEMYATARIESTRGRNALVVPDTAVQDVSGHKVVFVQSAPGRFQTRAVETGRNVEGAVEISAGLKPGELVVSKGAFALKSQLLASALEEPE